MKISNLYGKIIESEDKKTHGVIMAISCAKNVIDGYICFDEQEIEFYACAKDARILKDKVTFCQFGKEQKNAYRLRLGLPVYTQEGRFLGSVTDCSVMGGKIAAIFCKNKKYPADRLSISDAVIVKSPASSADIELAAKNMFIGALCGN